MKDQKINMVAPMSNIVFWVQKLSQTQVGILSYAIGCLVCKNTFFTSLKDGDDSSTKLRLNWNYHKFWRISFETHSNFIFCLAFWIKTYYLWDINWSIASLV